MKMTMGMLRRIIRESYEFDMGNVVFSHRRVDGAPRNEPDTEWEADLYTNLEAWVSDTWMPRSLPDTLMALTQSKYKNFFKTARSNETLYRGISRVPIERIERWFTAKKNKMNSAALDVLLSGEEMTDYVPCRILLRPRNEEGGPMSWSRDRGIAETFAATASPGSAEGTMNVVFMTTPARVPGGTFDLEKIQIAVPDLVYTSDTGEHDASETEGEVITFGDVTAIGVKRVSEKAWRNE